MDGRVTCILRITIGLLLFQLVLGQTCDRYWLLHEDTCFRNFVDNVSYLEAKKQCGSVRAKLVTNLTNGLEYHLLGPSEQDGNLSYWCKTGSDGDDDLFSSPGFILERKRRSTSCCYIQNMEYQMGECDELRGYICEKDPISLLHICLQNSTVFSNVSDWEGARRYCQCNGGDLYSFNGTQDEEHFLQIVRKRNQSMWIGLRREADSNEFLWSDGTFFSDSFWSAGQLSTDDNGKLCVAYIVKNASWEVVDCNSKLPFVCKNSRTPNDSTSDETEMETNTYDVLHNEISTEESDWFSVSYETNTEESDWYTTFDENNTITILTTLWNRTTQVQTTEAPLNNTSIDNSTAEAGYISACSPVFENCYVAGAVVGILILLTTAAIAVAYLRLRKKKAKKEEVPVQLLYVNSYKEDIPAKLLAAKIKEVIA